MPNYRPELRLNYNRNQDAVSINMNDSQNNEQRSSVSLFDKVKKIGAIASTIAVSAMGIAVGVAAIVTGAPIIGGLIVAATCIGIPIAGIYFYKSLTNQDQMENEQYHETNQELLRSFNLIDPDMVITDQESLDRVSVVRLLHQNSVFNEEDMTNHLREALADLSINPPLFVNIENFSDTGEGATSTLPAIPDSPPPSYRERLNSDLTPPPSYGL